MKLENAKGTRDFLPEDKILREKIISNLKEVFELFGYSPIETPALERFEVLSSKYTGGAEILKETFKLKDQGNRDLGLRYDLTVPFARVIGQNPTLKMPFKRYQIEKVWRDGPVNLGRYREFLQADIDVIGLKTMAIDAEMVEIAKVVFEKLTIDVTIKVNSRKILNAIMDYAGIEKNKHEVSILSLDKLDKVGIDGVRKELIDNAKISDEQIEKLVSIISITGKNEQKLISLKMKLTGIDAQEGLKEMEELLSYVEYENVIFDLTLARGLSYYTGTVFEAVPNESIIKSSVCGGGRYDKMIGNLLNQEKEYPAIGISFGVDRIMDILSRKEEQKKSVTQIYIIPIKTYKQSLDVARKLRKVGIKVDIDMQGKGPSKNLDYANVQKIPHVIFIGETELEANKFKLKDMKTGEEKLLSVNEIIHEINSIKE